MYCNNQLKRLLFILVLLCCLSCWSIDIPSLSWQQRSDWINVKTNIPAAVGDGITDDTAALQAALNSSTVGKTIYLPPGTYKITSTLVMHNSTGSTVIGDGSGTRIVWAGASGGVMFWSDGNPYTRYVGLSWDGNGTAAVGFDHAAKTTFETEIQHINETYRNFTSFGIRVGSNQVLASAEILYRNCLFSNCTNGIGMLAFNDYDNTIDQCQFENCSIGVLCDHGNFYARNSHFENSGVSDFYFNPEHGCSIRRCTSTGSKQFVNSINSVAPTTIQDCQVANWTATDTAVRLSSAPVTVFDCVFTNGPVGSFPIESTLGSQMVLISSNTPSSVGSLITGIAANRIYQIPPGSRTSSLTNSSQTFLQQFYSIPGRTFDAKRDFGAVGNGVADDTAAVQSTINAAQSYSRGSIAYVPSGSYKITQSLLVTGTNYFVGGSGVRSCLKWSGSAGVPFVIVSNAQNVCMLDMAVGYADCSVGNNGDDILITGSSGSNCTVTVDGVYVYGKYAMDPGNHGLRIASLTSNSVVNVSSVDGNVIITNSPLATVLFKTSYEGAVTLGGSSSNISPCFLTRLATHGNPALQVFDNHSITMSDFYIEQSQQAATYVGSISHTGAVTIQRPKMDFNSGYSNVFAVNGYNGRIFDGASQYYTTSTNTVFTTTGTTDLKLMFNGDFWYNSFPTFTLDANTSLALMGNGGGIADSGTNAASLSASAGALDDLRRAGNMDLAAQPLPQISGTPWAQHYGGTGSDVGTAIAVDASGNSYVAGTFQGLATFGATVLTSAGGNDIFIMKVNSAGTIQWVHGYGSTGNESVTQILLDSSGNIYIGGAFTGTANFGGTNTVATGTAGGYVAKYSSLGTFVWSKCVNASGTIQFNGIALDSSAQNVVAIGSFTGTATFNATNTFNSLSGGSDSFIAEYATATGFCVWAKTWGSIDIDNGLNVFFDSANNLFVVGQFAFQINLGNGIISSYPGTRDVYAARFPSSGSSAPGAAIWSKKIGSLNNTTPFSAGLDSSGDLTIGGIFTSQTDLGGGTITGPGFFTGFLAKYSRVDGSYVWGLMIPASASSVPNSIAFDSQKNPIACGNYVGTCNFGANTFTSIDATLGDSFVAKYTSDVGTAVWAKSWGGSDADNANDIQVDPTGAPIVTGYFGGTSTINGQVLTATGSLDVFLAHMNGATNTAASCSQADIQAAIAASNPGDTVIVPAGTCAPTVSILLTNQINLIAQGTILQDSIINTGDGAASSIISMSVGPIPAVETRISGFTFSVGSRATKLFDSGNIHLGGGANLVRIDNNNFLATQNIGIGGGSVFGVIDHNVFDAQGAFTQPMKLNHDSYGGGSFGDGAWALPPWTNTWNEDASALYIENNTFTNTSGAPGLGIDGQGGTRMVIRYNTFDRIITGGHGTETTGRERGVRLKDLYNNLYVNHNDSECGHYRSGSGVIVSNEVHNSSQFITIRAYRLDSNTNPWGQAQGTNAWDNNNPTLFGSGTVGFGGGGSMTDNTQNWTPNQWQGFSIMNASTGIGSWVINNTANTVTYNVSTFGTFAPFNGGNTYQFRKVTTILDEPGRGQGTFINTASPAYPNQALEPINSWSNTFFSVTGTVLNNGGYYPVVNGQELVNGKNNLWVPFTYPHPLVTGSNVPPPIPSPPSIVQQPHSTNILATQTALFTISVTGRTPLTYQWKTNGVNAGTNGPALSVGPAPVAWSGMSVVCFVSNSDGNATSATATLTVSPDPVINTQPANATVGVGATATFNVTATGQSTLQYQWSKNGSTIGGATASTYTTLATVAGDNNSQFFVVVTDTAGSLQSATATLTVTNIPAGPDPIITSQPQSTNIFNQQTAVFGITATGGSTLSYQWKTNGVNAGTNGPALGLGPAPVAWSGMSVVCIVTDLAGSVTSSVATLTVSPDPVISAQPQNVTVFVNHSATFSVTATGQTALSYQWSRNSSAVAGATQSSYATPLLNLPNNGDSYFVDVTDSAGTLRSATATLTVQAAQNQVAKVQNFRAGHVKIGP